MRKQVIMLLAAILGLSLLISGGITLVTNHHKNNRDKRRVEEYKINNIINEEYKKFKKEIETFSKTSVEFIDKISEVTDLYDRVESNYKIIVESLNEYEQSIKKIENSYKELKKLCVGKEYHKYEVNNKCRAFEKNMEQIINSYIKNVEAVNAKLDEYNKWTEEEENKEHKKLDKILSKLYAEYVDINKDGEFEGK